MMEQTDDWSLHDPISSLAEDITAAVEETLQDAIRETDWEQYAVLDVILLQDDHWDMTSMSLPEVEVRRYYEQAPPFGELVNQRAEVYRITRPLLERLPVDPETGELTADADELMGELS